MATSLRPVHSKVLLLIFPGFNTLDVNAPLEVLRKSGSSTIFSVTIAAEPSAELYTTSCEGAKMVADVAIDQNLLDNLKQYDILVVPGAPGSSIDAQLAKKDALFFRVIQQFAQLGPGTAPLMRICMSVCSGALFLANLGLFNDLEQYKFCTTHWGVYARLQQVNDAAAGGPDYGARVVPARFVDAGVNKYGVRIISSGAISCAMDASLHVVQIRAEAILGKGQGEVEARQTADMLDYRYSLKSEGITFDRDWSTSK